MSKMMIKLVQIGAIGVCTAIAVGVSHHSTVQVSASSQPGAAWSLRMTTPIETGIVCADMDQMLAFYTEILGLRVVSNAEALPEMSTKFGATPNGFRIVRLQTPHGERIKFVHPNKGLVKKGSEPRWVFERQGTSYVTFVIADVKDVAARLKSHRVKLMSDGPVEIRKGVLALFAQDPEGNFIEFVEYPDVAAYRPDLVR
jgi:catechol 2,3-dioxygenase-like lactoylglutathione lyase family enzyme